MQWLIANMWMSLGLATALGLLFGFSFRGLLASERVRRAMVEREITKTELAQSKAEIEGLYAAQRKLKASQSEHISDGVDAKLQADLVEREARIGALEEDLAAARAELEAASLDSADVTQPGSSDSQPDVEMPEELEQLRERNVWLEERVTALETQVSEGVSPSPEAGAAEAPAADTSTKKLQWQASYAQQRVAALEQKIISQGRKADVIPPVPEAETEAVVVQQPEPEPEPAAANPVDEELAQLRWRNRYLEGRLAYFEQAPEDEDDVAEASEETIPDDDPSPTDPAEPVSEVVDTEPEEAPEQEPEPDALETETEAETTEDAGTVAEVEPVSGPEPEEESAESDLESAEETVATEIHPSEAMLAELEGVQPLQLDRPKDGGDDLTRISGIGPRIAEVLNGLGIWTYAQIADWLPENQTWIENHLSFKGRVSRENWVEQARERMSVVEEVS